MRTTLDIDEDVLAAARAIARESGTSLGSAVSRLARDGIRGVGPIDIAAGFPTFAVGPESAIIDLDSVNENRD